MTYKTENFITSALGIFILVLISLLSISFVNDVVYSRSQEKTNIQATVPLTEDNCKTTINQYEKLISVQKNEIVELKNDLHLCWEEAAKFYVE